MLRAALKFPDAVAIITAYLRPLIATALARTVTVASRIPNPRPASGELVVVQRTGGPRALLLGGPRSLLTVDGAQITVDCWGPTPEKAYDLAQLVRRLLEDMAGTVQSGVSVHRVVEIGGPQDLPDPASDSPRVVQTLQVQIRGQAA